jgi:hypothetical protein
LLCRYAPRNDVLLLGSAKNDGFISLLVNEHLSRTGEKVSHTAVRGLLTPR